MFIIAHIPSNYYVYFIYDTVYKLSLYSVVLFRENNVDIYCFPQIGNIVYMNILSSPHNARHIMLNPASYVAWKLPV